MREYKTNGGWPTKIIRRTSLTVLPFAAALALLLLVVAPVTVQAQKGGEYDLTWSTIDNGGETGSSGGDYSHSGTAGQPDARNGITGGEYTVLSGFWPGEQILIQATDFLYLPIVMKAPVPNLRGSFSLNPPDPEPGEAVIITAVIVNDGSGDAGAFWVDFYINPAQTPRVNKRWNDICASICKGMAWYVSAGLPAGQQVTLTSRQVAGGYSEWDGSFPAGVTDLYLYVDSWNPTVLFGAVKESNENDNRSHLGVNISGLAPAGSAVKPDLPSRPIRLVQPDIEPGPTPMPTQPSPTALPTATQTPLQFTPSPVPTNTPVPVTLTATPDITATAPVTPTIGTSVTVTATLETAGTNNE
jgi:hypothetical protein